MFSVIDVVVDVSATATTLDWLSLFPTAWATAALALNSTKAIDKPNTTVSASRLEIRIVTPLLGDRDRC